jgi:hypothetical protein
VISFAAELDAEDAEPSLITMEPACVAFACRPHAWASDALAVLLRPPGLDE